MKLYLAPMEGLTTHIYRRVYAKFFPAADKYFAPFIAPDGEGNFRTASARDILPENNPGQNLVPQILCNRPEPFLAVARQLADMGYSELNLNLGCPSGTVVSKHKGSGAFADLRSLDDMLADIYASTPLPVSIKTRMGLESAEEFASIVEIYNKYPVSELIIHARTRAGMYSAPAEPAAFLRAAPLCRAELCYNGDIFRPEDASSLPDTDCFMLARGAMANPALLRELRGGAALERAELQAFHDALLAEHLSSGFDPRSACSRMKELWSYMRCLFPGSEREIKALNKSRTLEGYVSAANTIFSACAFEPTARFGYIK